jgi:arginyl-tRNA synthetase
MGMRKCGQLFDLLLCVCRKKLKTREGKAIRLRDLLKEGLERSMAKLQEKDRHNVTISFVCPDRLMISMVSLGTNT